jgi:predicted metalloprotease
MLVLLVLSVIFKQDFLSLVTTGGGVDMTVPGSSDSAVVQESPEEQRRVQFVSFILDDAQAVWREKFAEMGQTYQDATLVLYRDAVQSACGFAEAATGPFYCPGDEKVYIDLGFYDELAERFGAPGDFAQAYVLAHEIGHHVQRRLGIEARMRQAQQAQPGAANEYSVLLELQADCFAGVWGQSTAQRGILESGDLEEGLGAAAAVGDDRIQRSATGRVNPETFTHGSSQQRMEWFQRGFRSGDPKACDTFAANN